MHEDLVRDFAWYPMVHVFPFALADADGTARFHVSNNLQSSSLLPLKAHREVFPYVETVRQIEVPVRSLDSVIDEYGLEQPDLLYVDVQGAEYRVLAGLSEDRRARTRVIYTEASTIEMYEGAKLLSDLEVLLAPQGFELAGFQDMLQTRVHGDALFVNRRLE